MYLYEKKDKEIYIYGLHGNHKKIADYKKCELENFDVTFFVAEADASSPNKVLENSDIINIKNLNIKNSSVNPMLMISSVMAYDNKFHSFKKDIVDETILNNFYLGDYDNNRTVTVYKENVIPQFESSILDIGNFRGYGMEGIINDQKIVSTYSTERQIMHYLLITSNYKLERLSSHVVMKGIVSIPKSLYLLHLLNQGKFKEIGNENIDKQLSLFDFSLYPVSIIPLEYIENAFRYGLIDDSINDIEQKLENSGKILKKLK